MPLAHRRDAIARVRQWFESEWPAYYGPGGPGDAQRDLLDYAQQDALPFGQLAVLDGEPVCFAALKREPFPTHPQLTPWAGAAVVLPAWRRQGIGRALLDGLAVQASVMGFDRIHCATATSAYWPGVGAAPPQARVTRVVRTTRARMEAPGEGVALETPDASAC